MKNFKRALTFLLLFTIMCGINANAQKKDPLDVSIRETSNYLNANITKGSKIVILNIQSENTVLSEYIIDELISNAVNDKNFLVVDRQQLDAIRAEQNFQFAGEVDDKQALEIGKFFGAQTIISGGLNNAGKGYRLVIRALEVQTALVQGQFNSNIGSSKLIATIIKTNPAASTKPAGPPKGSVNITIVNNTGHVLSKLIYFPVNIVDEARLVEVEINDNEAKVVNLPFLNKSKKYVIGMKTQINSNDAYFEKYNFQIKPEITITFLSSDRYFELGDTGPAGGYIFFDAGNNKNGWRYLEAAPIDTEFSAPFSVKNTNINLTLWTDIGLGSSNTRKICELFENTSGEWDTAAQLCDELVFGGFDNWFLPSSNELLLMFRVLKKNDLGNFRDDWYWSSSNYIDNEGRISANPYIINFKDGKRDTSYITNRRFVRPIRRVPGPPN